MSPEPGSAAIRRARVRAFFRRHGPALLIVAVLSHLALVWLVPRAIMMRVMNMPGADGQVMVNRVTHAPPVDARSRRVVMPSPDLLYSICFYDVSRGPVHLSAHLSLPSYWSVALYADNSDNFFVRNDRAQKTQAIDLWLTGKNGAPGLPPGAQSLQVPSEKGIVLLRVLNTGAPADTARLEVQRQTFECQGPPKLSGN